MLLSNSSFKQLIFTLLEQLNANLQGISLPSHSCLQWHLQPVTFTHIFPPRAIQLCWNFKPYCFYFFPKSALLNWGCGLSTDAAYTRTFTVLPIDASPFRGYPQNYIWWYPFIHLGGVRHCESDLSYPRTQHNVKFIWNNSYLYCGCRWKWRVIIAVNFPI